MYVGRIVAVGRNQDGRSCVMYRVSSRSFPNRVAKLKEETAIIVPKEGHETDIHQNPYIAYTCIRIAGKTAIASNGSQTDPIAEKIAGGMTSRDAIAITLLTLDYEKDSYNTPRIVACIEAGAEKGLLGIVRADGLHVRELEISPGTAFYIATYEKDDVDTSQKDSLDIATADDGARHVIEGGVFGELTNPVTSACALEKKGAFELAVALA